MQTILNLKNQDYLKEPLFLGEDLHLQRYDRFKYPVFFDLFKRQMELFWRPEEISLIKDRNDFQTLSDNEKFIFTSNLKFQTMMDSVISRGTGVLLEYVSNPELEACINTWQFFETIHSYAYTYIIKNVYPKPEEILDSCLTDSEIIARAITAANCYDNLKFGSKDDIRKQLYLTLVNINILEGVRFYVSFVCAFNFGENKKMIGNADIIRLIKRDEAVHISITQNIINILRNNPNENMQDIIQDMESEVYSMFDVAVQEEKRWTEYLFKNGSLLGLSIPIMHNYIEWLADARLTGLGYKKRYNTKNPIRGWLDSWMDSEGVQVAPQESEITSYKIGAINNDLGEFDFT